MQVVYPYDPGEKAFSAKYSPSTGNYIAFGLANRTVIILDSSSYGYVKHADTGFTDILEVHFNAESNKLIVCGKTGNDGY